MDHYLELERDAYPAAERTKPGINSPKSYQNTLKFLKPMKQTSNKFNVTKRHKIFVFVIGNHYANQVLLPTLKSMSQRARAQVLQPKFYRFETMALLGDRRHFVFN